MATKKKPPARPRARAMQSAVVEVEITDTSRGHRVSVHPWAVEVSRRGSNGRPRAIQWRSNGSNIRIAFDKPGHFQERVPQGKGPHAACQSGPIRENATNAPDGRHKYTIDVEHNGKKFAIDPDYIIYP